MASQTVPSPTVPELPPSMIEIEVLGAERCLDGPSQKEIEQLCLLALATAGIDRGHLAIQYVDERYIAQLNDRYRGKQGPTDVLSFPIDGVEPAAQGVPLELGDVVICPEHTSDVSEAIVHGTLHLLGMDHETDDGEMLALQRELLTWQRERPA